MKSTEIAARLNIRISAITGKTKITVHRDGRAHTYIATKASHERALRWWRKHNA